MLQRGKLACIEFTGNIAGYASSVVRALHVPTAKSNTDRILSAVDRLLLLVYRLGPVMADTSGYAGGYWHYPSHRIAPHSRVAKVSSCFQVLKPRY